MWESNPTGTVSSDYDGFPFPPTCSHKLLHGHTDWHEIPGFTRSILHGEIQLGIGS